MCGLGVVHIDLYSGMPDKCNPTSSAYMSPSSPMTALRFPPQLPPQQHQQPPPSANHHHPSPDLHSHQQPHHSSHPNQRHHQQPPPPAHQHHHHIGQTTGVCIPIRFNLLMSLLPLYIYKPTGWQLRGRAVC